MNFKLNLMLIPFTVPRTAFNYLPSCDTIILNFPFRLAKSRLRRLLAGRPLRWVSPFSIIISTLEKGVGQIRLLFLHCEGKSAALSLEGLTVGRVVDSAQKSTRYSSRDYSIVGKNLYLIFTVWP